MSSLLTHPSTQRPAGAALRRLAAEHPVAAFCVLAFPLGWPLLTVRTTTTFAPTLVGYAFTYVALLGSALAVTWAGGGRAAVARFLARYLIWRFGIGRWGLVVLGIPALTVGVAAASGTLQVSGHGWAYVAGALLVQIFI